ncbi:hypothetical protein GOP47_0020867 [Adiantum capillus-veneris]|uniref:Uncharacterized protein n=1 Tax=Adiantum capillus-veneris TaxID=13818 RepID=A0A9D4UAS3_ADICA|nr:hypothetical protein GOP47_0020867 [Adiantum capillus-veneris]
MLVFKELIRWIIETGHFSCFPEYGSINILALMVEYSQRQYRVTDSLLIGQIFRKRWNKLHADVSSGPLRPASALRSSKSAETGSLADKKTGNQCEPQNGTLLAKSAETKSLGVDRNSNEDLAHNSSPILCGEKVLKDYKDRVPLISNSQTSWINHENFRCPLLSTEEAPYTQSHSQLNLTKRAAGSKGVVDKGRKCRKRKCSQEEIPGGKRKKAEVNRQANYHPDSDEDLSSGTKGFISRKGDINTQEHTGEQSRQNSVSRHELTEELALIKGDEQSTETYKESEKRGDEQLAETYKEPENIKSQADNILTTNMCMADDGIQRKQSKDSPSPIEETSVDNSWKLETSPAVCKLLHNHREEVRSCHANLNALKSSLNEKEYTTMEEEGAHQTLGKAPRGGGLPCSQISAENGAEGTEEVILNSRDRFGEMDLSMGYPIQLNDHSILLVASLSAEVIPETQESEIQSLDNKTVEGEEVFLPKRSLDISEHTAMEPHSNCFRQDSLVPQDIVAQGLPLHEDKRTLPSIDGNDGTGNLACIAEKKGTSNPKPCGVAVDPFSKSLNTEMNYASDDTKILGARNEDFHGQLHEIGHAGGNHDMTVQKKKKPRRKKVLKVDKVSVLEGSRFVGQDNQGIADSKKAEEIAVSLENPTETCNHLKGGESYHLLEEHAPTQLRTVDADPKEMQKQNATVLNVDEQNCEVSSFAGDETVALKKVLVDPPLAKESSEKCIEVSSKGGCETMRGELLLQERLTQSGGATHRKKKKKRRKEHPLPCSEGASGEKTLKVGNESNGVPFSIKELPNVLRQNTTKEGELRRKKKAKFADEHVTKKNSKKEMIETDPNIGLMQEQDQENAIKGLANRNDKERLLKDGLVESSSAGSPPKESCQEGLINSKPNVDVFDFESSETLNRPKENCIHTEVTSNPEADNLEKLCSVAVKLVEDNILNSSEMTSRKSSRKSVHPKRWITVLSERLNWSSKNNSKQQRTYKRRKPTAEGTGLPKDGELNPEPPYVEEEKEESSQIIVNDTRVACPAGCGKLYTKKTSAYYRHCKRCSGGDYWH